jgi:hypothetical protein
MHVPCVHFSASIFLPHPYILENVNYSQCSPNGTNVVEMLEHFEGSDQRE